MILLDVSQTYGFLAVDFHFLSILCRPKCLPLNGKNCKRFKEKKLVGHFKFQTKVKKKNPKKLSWKWPRYRNISKNKNFDNVQRLSQKQKFLKKISILIVCLALCKMFNPNNWWNVCDYGDQFKV